VPIKKKTSKVIRKKRTTYQELVDKINSELSTEKVQCLAGGDAVIAVSRVISTQFETLDGALGRGGLPGGRLTILHGKESSGKTTIALTVAAEAQRQGAMVVFLDAEHKLDPGWMIKCGVDLKKVIISQPRHLESSFEIMDRAITGAHELGTWAYVVLDSMNASITKAQFDADWETEIAYGPQAKYMSQKLPKLVALIEQRKALAVFISQTRANPGSKGDKLSCGNAPKFHASVIISTYAGTKIKTGSEVTGVTLNAKVIKNQVAPPFKEAQFVVAQDGPDFDWALIEQAVKKGLISKGAKGWYDWSRESDTLKFQGANGWRKKLEKDSSLDAELRRMVRRCFKL
jgi:recombination protein RecA